MQVEARTQTSYVSEQPRLREVVGGRKFMTYDPEFDTQAYVAFNALRFLDPVERKKQNNILDGYTWSNLQTMLGERFHVLLSKMTYDIRNGQLFSPNHPNEPVLEVFKRGQQYRKENGSSLEDQEREQAEIDTFSALQDKFCDPRTPEGTMQIVVSRPGKNLPGQKPSEYQHNFYDVYMKFNNTVLYRRYSSALTAQETFAKMLKLNPWYAMPERGSDPDFIPDDVYFLKHPIYLDPKVNPNLTSDAIHASFHKEHEFMQEDQYSYILAACQGYIDAYIRIVSQNPTDRKMRNLAYNALLNRADEVAQTFKRTQERGGIGSYDRQWALQPTDAQLVMMGSKAVREVTTGCGRAGGMSLTELLERNPVQDMARSRFSMLDFGLLEFSGELGYTFIEPEEGENCKTCGEHVSLGPCGICRSCDRYIRFQNGQSLPIAA